MRVLLPLPLTPVTATNLPNGKSTETFFKLFLLQSIKRNFLCTESLLLVGVGIDERPLR